MLDRTRYFTKSLHILICLFSLTNALTTPPEGFPDNLQDDPEQEVVIAPTNPYYDVNGVNIPPEKLTACHLRERKIFADWTRVLNPHPFKNTITPDKNFCSDPDLFLVVYVHTSVYRHKRRAIIRRTWGNPDNYDKKIRVVFVVGESFKHEHQRPLLMEASTYGDMLQSDFFDSYRNLTYKAVSGLKWVTRHCQHASFVLKSDDDVFINMFVLIKHLQYKLSLNHYRQHVLICNVLWRDVVAREAKWKVTWDECASTYWPPFCQGVAFVMTMDVARGLYYASYHVPYLWLDDVYITGFLPLALPGQVELVEMNHRYMSANHIPYAELLDVFTWPRWYRMVFFHVNNLDASQAAWKALLKNMKGNVYQTFANEASSYSDNNSTVTEEEDLD